ncbi:discoidin domain-containing protein [Proteiniphilum acetatigenes]|uniref:discoidin domain-containing protein n=1 Tax=Proteiniphilum acetatigenes TaxID=294710 RepID=UPI0003681BC1|nr:discoidin domain-containing protein [Proteiniphilum acetatigenes]
MKIKSYISYCLGAILCVSSIIGCSGDYDSFVDSDQKITGKPSPVSNITSDELPGQIKLNWDIPADSNFYFLKITYFDHLTQTEKTKVASVYTDELIIDNTRAKFGDYQFAFQTFNSNNEGGDITSLSAKSGIAPAIETITSTKLKLDNSQFSTDNQEPSEGPISNLNDGNPNTFFHTRWSSPQVPLPQYIQVDLYEPLTNFSFSYQNRNGAQVGPEHLKVLISNDDTDWTEIAEFTSGLPSASQAIYNSPVIRNSTPFTYVRFSVTKTYGDRNYFNLAEFMLYDVQIDIYDPESD